MTTSKFMKARDKPMFLLESFNYSSPQFLTEGIIRTYNPEFVIKRLQGRIKDDFGINMFEVESDDNVEYDDSYIFINYPNNKLSNKYCGGAYSKLELGIYRIGMCIYVDEPNLDESSKLEEFKDSIDKVCQWAGMFISIAKSSPCRESRNARIFTIVVEPKFSDRDFELSKCPDIKFLYHLTKSSRVARILKGGLNPKSSNAKFKYPDRIYLGLDPYGLEHDLLMKFNELDNTGRQDTHSILKIDISKIPSKNRFKVDPNYPDGLFTSDNIPPSAIGVFKTGIV